MGAADAAVGERARRPDGRHRGCDPSCATNSGCIDECDDFLAPVPEPSVVRRQLAELRVGTRSRASAVDGAAEAGLLAGP